MAHAFSFVDTIASSPTTRLNLSDGTTWKVLLDGSRAPTPELQYSRVSSMLVDGEHIPAAAYRNRYVTLNLQLVAANVDTWATEVQKLARELDRPSNILKWAPSGATHPVFFRTLRSPLGELQEVLLTHQRAQVTIEAEPFAFGLPVTGSPVTVNNDPAAGSNGQYFDVSSVKGDVETPLIMTVTAADVIATGRRVSAVAVRRRGTPSSAPFLLQAEAMTLGTNTTLPGADAVMSGGGSSYARCTFGTPTMTTRLTMAPFPSSAGVDVRGTYRVLARLRKQTAAEPMTVRLTVDLDGTDVEGDIKTVTTTSSRHYCDLGLLQIPLGRDPITDGYSNTELSVRGVAVEFEAARSSGSGYLDIDCLLFVPADDGFAWLKWPAASGPTSFVVDGSRGGMVYALGGSGEVRSAVPVEVEGRLPMLAPNQTNRVYFLLDVGDGAAADDITETVGITPSYYPRYLLVRPAST